MMWHGTYERWNPIPALEGNRLYCEAVHDDWEGFRVWLRPERPIQGPVIIRFADVLLSASSDESFRIAPILPKQRMRLPHAFWKVTGSEFIHMFHRASCEAYTDWSITHFAFLTCNTCVDVLSVEEPALEWDGC